MAGLCERCHLVAALYYTTNKPAILAARLPVLPLRSALCHPRLGPVWQPRLERVQHVLPGTIRTGPAQQPRGEKTTARGPPRRGARTPPRRGARRGAGRAVPRQGGVPCAQGLGGLGQLVLGELGGFGGSGAGQGPHKHAAVGRDRDERPAVEGQHQGRDPSCMGCLGACHDHACRCVDDQQATGNVGNRQHPRVASHGHDGVHAVLAAHRFHGWHLFAHDAVLHVPHRQAPLGGRHDHVATRCTGHVRVLGRVAVVLHKVVGRACSSFQLLPYRRQHTHRCACKT